MTDNNNRDDEFEFDDFFPEDDQTGDIDLGDDDGPPITGEYDQDMPVMDTEPERSNRTFVILAVALILLFVIGLVAILILASRDTGPSEAEQSATAGFATNEFIAQLALETATQDVINIQLTQTALAFSPTPTDTPQPTSTPTETATFTATFTGTPDLTATAVFEALDAVARTQTALAASPTPTITLTPTVPPVDLQALYATEAAQATSIGAFQESAYATLQALATLAAGGAIDQPGIGGVIADQAATLAAIQAQDALVDQAVDQLDRALATSAALNATLAFNLALATSNAPGLQGNLATPAAQATLNALTIQATLTALAPDDPSLPPATATALAEVPGLLTPEGLATQNALATRLAFVEAALGTLTIPTETPVPVEPTATVDTSIPPAALTATAIVQGYLTETAQAQITPVTETPIAPAGATTPPFIVQATTPAELPDTGLFDDVSSGGIGVLSIALIGLVGVIVAARVMRNRK